ncbi:MAG: type II toxin-antitoxin system HipA family toxin [Ignavibacteria bacterium]|nr:type II toxin-antitoxin system HipA family toxin [Ignavibacteria bacterium]
MKNVAEVQLWGKPIGALVLDDGARTANFQFEADFTQSGINPAPLTMPLSSKSYSFPELPFATFSGLPGMIADSLPDKFGNAIINLWLATQGRLASTITTVERLCYVGSRGMGALEFVPSKRLIDATESPLQIEHLVNLASEILAERTELHGTLKERTKAMNDILRVGTSAGGARAKAVVAWNKVTGEIRSGQVDSGDGFDHWLIKFDGVVNNADKNLADPAGFGLIEYSYFQMAIAAGITMSECDLLHEGGRHHFMTRRFDRPHNNEKLHMQTLCAMAHFDFNSPGAHSYEQAFIVLKQLRLPMSDTEELFRRMVFNVIARNQDDHVKNISFLMDKSGKWWLAPAYDVVYSYNPNGAWTSSHQISINGKRDHFTTHDILECATFAGIRKAKALSIIDDVKGAVQNWQVVATNNGIDERTIQQIQTAFRLDV